MQIFVDADAVDYKLISICHKGDVGCMLGNKYRMTTHWCLFAFICYICRSFSFCNEILCMWSDCVQPFFIYVINIFLLQMETASELGIIQPLK